MVQAECALKGCTHAVGGVPLTQNAAIFTHGAACADACECRLPGHV